MTLSAIDPLMLPIPEQKLYYANRRIATLQAAIAQTVPPAPLSGAFSMRYEHPSLGWLTAGKTSKTNKTTSPAKSGLFYA